MDEKVQQKLESELKMRELVYKQECDALNSKVVEQEIRIKELENELSLQAAAQGEQREAAQQLGAQSTQAAQSAKQAEGDAFASNQHQLNELKDLQREVQMRQLQQINELN